MDFIIHEYDRRIESTLRLIDEELSPENVELIRAYDRDMVSNSLAKATRLKNLRLS